MAKSLKSKIREKLSNLIFLKNNSGDRDAYHKLKTRKSKVFFIIFYLWHMKTCGQGRVIGRFTNAIPEVGGALIISNYLFGYIPSKKAILIMVLVYLVLVQIIGWLYMYYGIDRIESTVSIQRDEFQRTVMKGKEREQL